MSDAVKVNPSFVKSNFIPANAGTKFLVDKAFDTLFKFSNNISFLYLYNNSNNVENCGKLFQNHMYQGFASFFYCGKLCGKLRVIHN